jgi:hypothetical protein
VTWIFIVAVAVVIVASIWQLRPGGKGPAVQWFPRSMRRTVNTAFRRRGWPEPYDESGNKIPRSQRG